MNTYTLKLSAFLPMPSIAAVTATAAHKSVDARTLDVAGVKTGMDYDQSVTAVTRTSKDLLGKQ